MLRCHQRTLRSSRSYLIGIESSLRPASMQGSRALTSGRGRFAELVDISSAVCRRDVKPGQSNSAGSTLHPSLILRPDNGCNADYAPGAGGHPKK